MGTILSFEQRGELNVVIASTEGGPEPDIVLVVPVGVEYEPAVGDPVIVFPFESTEGEFACWPGSFKPTTSTSDFVALKTDMDNAKVAIDELQIHTHPVTTAPGTTGPPSTLLPTAPTSQGSDRFRVTHG